MSDINDQDQLDLYDMQASHTEMLAARRAVLDILGQVLTSRRPLDQVLERHEDFKSLPGRDRAFARMLATTVIRRLGQIDDLIRQCLSKPGPLSPPGLEMILRLGAAQLVFMNTAAHAAVNTSVQLCEEAGLGKKKGFVNAILRRIARDGRDMTARQDIPRLNTPEWLLKHWIADYGLRGAVEIGQANMAEAPLDITVKQHAELETWAQALEATILPTGTLRRMDGGGGAIDTLPGYGDGMWWIQDSSAALPVRLMGDIQGRGVLDLCAAPGGKTAQLAAAGAHVRALDRSATRVGRLESNLARLRLGSSVAVEVADAAVWQPAEPADLVLLDAPCTATGTLRRHPDVAWLKTPEDMEALTRVQARILDNAIGMLAPGGMLVYCTCSLQKDEGEAQIAALLNRHSRIERVPVRAKELGGLEDAVNDEGDVRLLPYHMAAYGGTDGFFISRLRRTG